MTNDNNTHQRYNGERMQRASRLTFYFVDGTEHVFWTSKYTMYTESYPRCVFFNINPELITVDGKHVTIAPTPENVPPERITQFFRADGKHVFNMKIESFLILA